MNPTSGPYHIIRSTFFRLSPVNRKKVSIAERELHDLLSGIHRSLHVDGLFVIGSTAEDDKRSVATLFRRSAGGSPSGT